MANDVVVTVQGAVNFHVNLATKWKELSGLVDDLHPSFEHLVIVNDQYLNFDVEVRVENREERDERALKLMLATEPEYVTADNCTAINGYASNLLVAKANASPILAKVLQAHREEVVQLMQNMTDPEIKRLNNLSQILGSLSDSIQKAIALSASDAQTIATLRPLIVAGSTKGLARIKQDISSQPDNAIVIESDFVAGNLYRAALAEVLPATYFDWLGSSSRVAIIADTHTLVEQQVRRPTRDGVKSAVGALTGMVLKLAGIENRSQDANPEALAVKW